MRSNLLSKPSWNVAVVLAAVVAATSADARVVSRQAAQSAGLTRAWFTQATLDPRTQQIVGAVLDHGGVYVLSSSGSLQAIDAATGTTRWTTRLGAPSLPAYGPAVHQSVSIDAEGNEITTTRCAVIIGSTLFVIDGSNGAEVFSRSTASSPATAPVLGDKHAYVAMLSGRLVGYPFDQVKGVPFVVASPGQLAVQPLFAQGQIIWSTRRGEVYGADAETGRPSYRFDAAAPIAGTPSAIESRMYFANQQGVVYAMEAEKARPIWRTSVGNRVTKPVVAVGETVYVQADGPSLYALDIASGKQLWNVEGVADFVSASAERVYAVAPGGALAVLDRATGRPVGSWPAAGSLTPLPNTEDDRLFFVSKSGLIQCFEEPGRNKPKDDVPAEGEAEPAEEAQPPADEFDQPLEEPADEPLDPFAPAEEAEGQADDPFAPSDTPAADDPFAPQGGDGAAGESDDPFADF